MDKSTSLSAVQKLNSLFFGIQSIILIFLVLTNSILILNLDSIRYLFTCDHSRTKDSKSVFVSRTGLSIHLVLLDIRATLHEHRGETKTKVLEKMDSLRFSTTAGSLWDADL